MLHVVGERKIRGCQARRERWVGDCLTVALKSDRALQEVFAFKRQWHLRARLPDLDQRRDVHVLLINHEREHDRPHQGHRRDLRRFEKDGDPAVRKVDDVIQNVIVSDVNFYRDRTT